MHSLITSKTWIFRRLYVRSYKAIAVHKNENKGCFLTDKVKVFIVVENAFSRITCSWNFCENRSSVN